MKLVYIAGLQHSGSTILDMALGCNEKMVGLGEIYQILKADKSDLQNHKNYNDIFCSCGKITNECEFWKGAKYELVSSDYSDLYEKYAVIIRYFEKLYGKDVILLDSSKDINEYLLKLNENYDLKIINIVRDVRSWGYSRHSRLNASYPKLFVMWYLRNLRILNFLNRNNLKYMTFGYEEIAMYPVEMLNKICSFIGIEYDDRMLVPDNSNSHVFNGNVAKGDKTKRRGFIYDARWLTSLSIMFYSILFLPIMVFNRRIVYSNFMKGKTFAFRKKQQDFIIFGDKEKERLVSQNYGIK